MQVLIRFRIAAACYSLSQSERLFSAFGIAALFLGSSDSCFYRHCPVDFRDCNCSWECGGRGGLYEAQLDYRIVKYIKDMAHGTDEDKLRIKRELLVTVASGNLMLEKGNPQESIPNSLMVPGE